jgi:hypothetical protein
MKTHRCTDDARRGRLNKATQFLEAADIIATLTEDEAELIDAYITLCVHAGIAANDLNKLLGMTTKSGYSATPSPVRDRRAAGRAAERLVAAAKSTSSPLPPPQ